MKGYNDLLSKLKDANTKVLKEIQDEKGNPQTTLFLTKDNEVLMATYSNSGMVISQEGYLGERWNDKGELI